MSENPTDDDRMEAAFRRASDAIDAVWTLDRARRATQAYRIATLSSSLADPRAHDVEIALSRARSAIHDDTDRAAFIQIARACQAQGLIDLAATERLIRDFTAPG